MFKGEKAFEIKLLTLGKFIFQCFDVFKGEKAYEIKLFTSLGNLYFNALMCSRERKRSKSSYSLLANFSRSLSVCARVSV